MTNPNTRLDEGETEFECELLRAWTNENPSSSARAKAFGLVATGAVLGATSATDAAGAALRTVAQTATPKVATIGALAVVKWLAAGAILVVGTASVAPYVLSRPTTQTAAPTAPSSGMAVPKWTAPTERVVPDPARPQEAPPSVSDRVVSPAARPTASVASAAAHVGSPSTSTSGTAGRVAPLLSQAMPAPSAEGLVDERHGSLALGDQVISLDEARNALAGGNAAEATRLLDEYEARFPNGSLRQEATVLRVEALVKQGDRQRATALGAQFLSAHPTSPHATKIRDLLSGEDSP